MLTNRSIKVNLVESEKWEEKQETKKCIARIKSNRKANRAQNSFIKWFVCSWKEDSVDILEEPVQWATKIDY